MEFLLGRTGEGRSNGISTDNILPTTKATKMKTRTRETMPDHRQTRHAGMRRQRRFSVVCKSSRRPIAFAGNIPPNDCASAATATNPGPRRGNVKDTPPARPSWRCAAAKPFFVLQNAFPARKGKNSPPLPASAVVTRRSKDNTRPPHTGYRRNAAQKPFYAFFEWRFDSGRERTAIAGRIARDISEKTARPISFLLWNTAGKRADRNSTTGSRNGTEKRTASQDRFKQHWKWRRTADGFCQRKRPDPYNGSRPEKECVTWEGIVRGVIRRRRQFGTEPPE